VASIDIDVSDPSITPRLVRQLQGCDLNPGWDIHFYPANVLGYDLQDGEVALVFTDHRGDTSSDVPVLVLDTVYGVFREIT